MRVAAPRLAALSLAALLAGFTAPAQAIVGGAPAGDAMKAKVALIVSTRGASCSGAVLAPDLVLTAAHCVQPAADYAVVVFEAAGPRLIPASQVRVHPRFDPASFQTRRPTPDLALVKLSSPLPASFRPVTLASGGGMPVPGDVFTLAGFGVTSDGDGKSAGTLRTVNVPSVGTTGGIMVRLSKGSGAGACTGDSGAPAFRGDIVAGVVGWSTGPGNGRGCGGVTGATLVALHRDWIDGTARSLGVVLP